MAKRRKGLSQKNINAIVGILIALAGAYIAKNHMGSEGENFNSVQLVSVYDGDTFTVNLPCESDTMCKNAKVRVNAIDCAEMKTEDICEKAAAKKAQKFSENFLHGGEIQLLNCTKDKYFRLLCDVEVNSVSLAQELLKNKLAVEYHGKTKQKIDWCKFK